jgi:hypothetical protein
MSRKYILSNQVNATTAGVLVNPLQSSRSDVELRLLNLSTNTVYLGGNGVTTANGFPLRPYSLNVPETVIECSSNVYVIVASGTSAVAVVETY